MRRDEFSAFESAKQFAADAHERGARADCAT
jgi:hypothetical protein